MSSLLTYKENTFVMLVEKKNVNWLVEELGDVLEEHEILIRIIKDGTLINYINKSNSG
jgi:hypothetical protein